MKSHILRPLWSVAGIVAITMIGRLFIVPSASVIHEKGFIKNNNVDAGFVLRRVNCLPARIHYS